MYIYINTYLYYHTKKNWAMDLWVQVLEWLAASRTQNFCTTALLSPQTWKCKDFIVLFSQSWYQIFNNEIPNSQSWLRDLDEKDISNLKYKARKLTYKNLWVCFLVFVYLFQLSLSCNAMILKKRKE